MKQCVFALLLGAVISAQSADTVESHVAAAQALNAASPTALINLCTPEQASRANAAAAPRWPAGRRAAARRASRSIPLGARADESIRQPVLRRRARILVVGRDDIGRDHHHRSDLRLFSRRAGRRRIEEARARSRADQIRRRQPRPSRSRGGRVVSPGAVRRSRPADRARLGHARAQQAELAEAEARHGGRRSPAADARRYDADVHSHVRSHAGDDVDARAGQGQRQAARCRVVGRDRVQLHHYAAAAGVALVRRVHRVGAAIQGGGGESGRGRVSLESSELGRLRREDGEAGQARRRRAASLRDWREKRAELFHDRRTLRPGGKASRRTGRQTLFSFA